MLRFAVSYERTPPPILRIQMLTIAAEQMLQKYTMSNRQDCSFQINTAVERSDLSSKVRIASSTIGVYSILRVDFFALLPA